MLVEILIVIMIIIYFILYKLATMNPLGWHSPHLMDNTDTLYLGPGLATCSVFFLDFFIFVFISLPMCQSVSLSVCGSVCLYSSVYLCVSQSVCLWVCRSVCNPSQAFKKSLLWGSQWALRQEMTKTQILTLVEWGCPLDNNRKLVKGWPNSKKKKSDVYMIFYPGLELKKYLIKTFRDSSIIF